VTRQSAQRGSKRTPPTTVRLDPELDAWVRAAQKNFGGQSALINAAVRELRNKVEAKQELLVSVIGGNG
jgi:Arc/MetJ-type ribon-helix-helix transcriptional regulator